VKQLIDYPYGSQFYPTVMPRERKQRDSDLQLRIGLYQRNENRNNRNDYELLRTQITSLTTNIQIIAQIIVQIIADLFNIVYPLETDLNENLNSVIIANQQLSVTNNTLREIRISILDLLLNRQSLSTTTTSTANPYFNKTMNNSYLPTTNSSYGYGNLQR
jgi:hypothetical protein